MVRLSVIVPVYNVEQYLPRCIDSILQQTFKDLELILVDDGSSDGSGRICDAYAQQDSRVRTIHQKNQGQSVARNTALDIAQGEYIGFVDSDDAISPDMYQRLLDLADSCQADIAVCGYSEVDMEGNVTAQYPKARKVPTIYTSQNAIENFFPVICWDIGASLWDKVFKQSLFKGLRFPAGRIYEDTAIQLPLYDRCKKIIVAPTYDYQYYCARTDSTMNAAYSVKRFDLIELAVSQYEFFTYKTLKTQQGYALEQYTRNYMINFFAVHISHKDLKENFLRYEKQFRGYLKKILAEPRICNMRKFTVLMMYINEKLAYRLCRKYFPECLPEFLRVKN